jgi:hypothetical protein
MPKVKRLLAISFFELPHASLEVVNVDGPGEVGLFGVPLSLKASLKRGERAIEECHGSARWRKIFLA